MDGTGNGEKIILEIYYIRDQFRGICEGAGSPGCKAAMVCMVVLTALRTWNNRHFPVAFLGIVNTGVFQGLLVGSM